MQARYGTGMCNILLPSTPEKSKSWRSSPCSELQTFQPTGSPLRGPPSGDCYKYLAVPGDLCVSFLSFVFPCGFCCRYFCSFLSLTPYSTTSIALHLSPHYTKPWKALGISVVWRPVPCHKAIEVFALRAVLLLTHFCAPRPACWWGWWCRGHLASTCTALSHVKVHKAQGTRY